MHPPSPALQKELLQPRLVGVEMGLGEWSVAQPRGLWAGQRAEKPRLPFLRENLGRDSGLRVQSPSELIFRGPGAEKN